MDQVKKKVDESIKKKLGKLTEAQFEESACYEFLGSLNFYEIDRFVEILTANDISGVPPDMKDFVVAYLKKLSEKIIKEP